MSPLNLRIKRIHKHTPDVWSFFMEPRDVERPGFTAGQVAVLEIEDFGSMYVAFASAPEDKGFEFLIKRGDGTGMSAALFDLHKGDNVVLKEIAGRGFPVEDFRGRDLVFVAMGTGLAPLRAVLRHIFHAREKYGRLIVLYGARAVEDFCFQEEITTLWRDQGVELRQVISQPGNGDWSGPTGYVQGLLDHLTPELDQPIALVCGSSEMINQTRERLYELGFAPERVLTNY